MSALFTSALRDFHEGGGAARAGGAARGARGARGGAEGVA